MKKIFPIFLIVQKVFKQQKAIEAMKKLKGSGNGNLVSALLTEREKEIRTD